MIKEENLVRRKNRSVSRSVSYSAFPDCEEEEEKSYRIIKVGVCAMEKKIKSDSMQEIIKRLNPPNDPDFDIIIFEEEMILNKKITEWPIVEALITFYSNGFPFIKVKQYCELR